MDVDNEGPAPEDEQSGTASVSQGLETPDSINLKKEPYKSFFSHILPHIGKRSSCSRFLINKMLVLETL